MLSRPNLYYLITLATLLACPIAANAQVDKAELAKKAKAILQKNCQRCHNGEHAEGGISYIILQSRLVDEKKVRPRNSEGSRIYERMIDKDDPMPPVEEKQRPGEEDKSVIKQWIDAGAPDFDPPLAQREFIRPAKMLEMMLKDLNTEVKEHKREFTRYFTLTHLWNAGFSEPEMESYRNGLSKLVNSLSWKKTIVIPQPIPTDPTKSILRIDITDYAWDANTWDAILASNPYGITYTTEAAQTFYKSTQCQQPHVHGDWFVHAAARPDLYYTILRIPKTDNELETKLDIDVAKNIQNGLVLRAGFKDSGVSVEKNHRLIEWHETAYGSYWKSYDFAGNVDRKNLFQHPLGPGDARNFFQQDGGEIIFTLPNKLQAYMLIDAKGNRINVGPTTVVVDRKAVDRGRKPDVINGISCMSCHAKGMINKDDQVREVVLNAKDSYTPQEVAKIQIIYPEKQKFNEKLNESSKLFQEAVQRTGAKLSTTEPIVALSARFEDELNLNLAAAESGVTPDELLIALKKKPTTLGRALSGIQSPGGTVQRGVLDEEFGELVEVLQPQSAFIHDQVDFSASRKYKQIGEETIESYRKLGATFDKLVFDPLGNRAFELSTDETAGLPGFYFKQKLSVNLAQLPTIHEPFWLSLHHSQSVRLTELKHLKTLTLLDLSETAIADTELKNLNSFPNLSALHLNETAISDVGLNELTNLRNLRFISLHKTQVTDIGLKKLTELKNLRCIILSQCKKVTDVGLRDLKNLKSLEYLNLEYTSLTDTGLRELKGLNNLVHLNISANLITDSGLRELKELNSLRYLDLTFSDLTDEGLKELNNLKNLSHIRLHGCKRLTDVGLRDFVNLTHLEFSDCKEVTGDGLKFLINLTALRLSNTKLSDNGLKEMKNLRKLKGLDLSHSALSNAGLSGLKDLTNLVQLDMSYTNVTDTDLKELRNLSNLNSLKINDTKVTDAGLKELKILKNLKKLDVSDTKVTFAGKKELQEALPNCDIYGASNSP